MECPRCDRPLVRYALGGREAVVCESCGYIGVPVEHRGELQDVESWDDAISRFEEVSPVEAGFVETSDDDASPPLTGEGEGTEPEPTVVRIDDSDGNGVADIVADTRVDTNGGAVCERCGKRFDSRSQLNGHMAVHSTDDADG